MALVKWDPFRNVATLQDRINRLFEDAFPRTRDQEDDLSLCAWRPAVDIYQTEKGLVLKAELPGIKKEDVSVEIKDNILTLKGDRAEDKEVSEDNYYRRERCFGSFQRSFNLEHNVQPDKVKAKFKDGILEIQIPRPEKEKTKKVTVDVD